MPGGGGGWTPLLSMFSFIPRAIPFRASLSTARNEVKAVMLESLRQKNKILYLCSRYLQIKNGEEGMSKAISQRRVKADAAGQGQKMHHCADVILPVRSKRQMC